MSDVVDASSEAPREPTGPAFSEAITFAFGDAERDRYGVARIGVSGETGALASGLAVLFADRLPVAVRAEGGEVAARSDDWSAAVAGGVSTRVVEPLRRWTVAFDGGEDGGFDLEVEALTDPGVLDPASGAARVGGMVGYEQIVRVRGPVRVGTSTVAIDCLGQRGHSWGEPDWSDLAEARTITAWAGPSLAASCVAIRRTGQKAHDRDATGATFFGPEGPVTIAEARLSATLDGDGRQRKASLELYEDEESAYAHRAAGQVLCGTTLDLGRLTLDTSFFAWSFEGQPAIGRFDVLRRPCVITTVISDLGGVMTSPLADAFAAVQADFGVAPDAIERAMTAFGGRLGANPLFELETGRLGETDFLEGIAAELPGVEFHRFPELWWAALAVNQPVVDLLAEARDAGFRMALLTNNVREWEPRWRSVWPIDELFSVVVDSGFVGLRKPDPAIYELTLERLGGVAAGECVFLDDFAVNCEAATALGMTAVQFVTTEQAVADMRALLFS